MHWRKLLYLISLNGSLAILIFFLAACSGDNKSQPGDAQPAKIQKAKIVYFSIPG